MSGAFGESPPRDDYLRSFIPRRLDQPDAPLPTQPTSET